jgi:hypothetical protein
VFDPENIMPAGPVAPVTLVMLVRPVVPEGPIPLDTKLVPGPVEETLLLVYVSVLITGR